MLILIGNYWPSNKLHSERVMPEHWRILNMQGHRAEILQDIAILTRIPYPGSLEILPGSNAEAVVTSAEGHVIAAATSYGKGRIFAITHTQYFAAFKEGECKDESITQLHENVRQWVSGGRCQGQQDIRLVKRLKGEVKGEVLLYHGGKIAVGMAEKVAEFVENGGGLVHAVCPWLWQAKHKPQSLKDMPLAGLMESAGLLHTMRVVRCNRDGFRTCDTDGPCPNCGEASTPINEEVADETDDASNEEKDTDDEQVLEPEEEGGTPEEWKNYEAYVMKVRTQILQGVHPVIKYGAPGCCVPFGKQSVSVISGSDPQNVFMASGELGKGRVVIITHTEYYKRRHQGPVRKLMKNVFEWAAGGEEVKDPEEILVLTDDNNFEGKKIAVWTDAYIDAAESAKVREFVKAGGGLIHTAAAWGWLKLNPNKRIKDLPLTEILIEAGLFLTRELCANSGKFKIDVSDAGCREEAVQNIGYLLARAQSLEELERYGECLSLGLGPAPAVVKAQLEKDIKAAFDCHKAKARYPLREKPLTDPAQQCVTLLCDELCNLGSEMRCIPCVDDFPGACPQAPGVCAEREVTTRHKNFHSTGLYAPPGADIQVEVLSSRHTLNDGWVLRIGSHTDQVFKKDTWRRWPSIVKRRDIDEAHFTLFSPYGGLIYLESNNFGKEKTMAVRLSNVVESPRYSSQEPDAQKKWLESRDNVGPWADLCGRYISFSLPSASVRHLDDPGSVLEVWDRVVASNCDLRGTDPSEHRHQWVVCDAQPSAGYMHAGYPVVTMMDVADPERPEKFLLDLDSLVTIGRWGLFHELGHNMQRRWWSFKGTGEVTCNIFTLHAMQLIANKQPWIIGWLEKFLPKMKAALKKPDPYEIWRRDPGVALGLYAQLQHCFGWDAYKKVFRIYEAMDWRDLPNKTEDRIECWIETFSKTVGFNLRPLFEYWGFHLGDAVGEQLALPPFLPDDEMTRLAPDRVRDLEKKYPNLVRQLD